MTFVLSGTGLVLISAAAHGSPLAANVGALLLLPILLLGRLGLIDIQLSPEFRPNAVVAIGGFLLIQFAYYWLIVAFCRRLLRLFLQSTIRDS
jgi:hypothetical protein